MFMTFSIKVSKFIISCALDSIKIIFTWSISVLAMLQGIHPKRDLVACVVPLGPVLTSKGVYASDMS